MKLVSSGVNGKINLHHVEVLKETPKTFQVRVKRIIEADRVVRKDEIGEVKSGAFYGSFKCYCEDGDTLDAFAKVQSAIQSYANERIKMAQEMLENCEGLII